MQIANQVVSGRCQGVVLSSGGGGGHAGLARAAPLGGRHVVTQAERNIVVALDNRPALDVMLEALGCDLRGLRQSARDTFVGLVVPGAGLPGAATTSGNLGRHRSAEQAHRHRRCGRLMARN